MSCCTKVPGLSWQRRRSEGPQAKSGTACHQSRVAASASREGLRWVPAPAAQRRTERPRDAGEPAQGHTARRLRSWTQAGKCRHSHKEAAQAQWTVAQPRGQRPVTHGDHRALFGLQVKTSSFHVGPWSWGSWRAPLLPAAGHKAQEGLLTLRKDFLFVRTQHARPLEVNDTTDEIYSAS